MVCNDRKIGQIPSTSVRVPRGRPVNKPFTGYGHQNRSGVGFLPQTFVKETIWSLGQSCKAAVRAMSTCLERLCERLIWRVYHHTMRFVADDPEWQEAFLAHLEPRAGEHILILGLGSAAKGLSWAERYPDTSFTAADPDPKATERARVLVETRGLKNIELQALDQTSLRLKTASVDAIFSYLATEHLSSAQAGAQERECLRVLRRGGRWLRASLDHPTQAGEMVASLLLRVTYGGEPARPAVGEPQSQGAGDARSVKFRRVASFSAPRARVALDRARKRRSQESVIL